MNAFFANMHPSFSHSLTTMLTRCGHHVFTPDEQFAKAIRLCDNNHKMDYKNIDWHKPEGAQTISQEGFKKLKMDVVFLLCIEQELGHFWEHVAGHPDKPVVVHYAGNDSVPYNPHRVRHLVAADATTLQRINPPHWLYFYPILPFEQFPYLGDERAEDADPEVSSFVVAMEEHWPRAKAEFSQLADLMREGLPQVSLTNYGGLTRPEVKATQARSLLTLHFKDAEGYGYAVLESLAQGVPVLAPRWLTQGRTLSKFIIDGETGWIVDNPHQAYDIIQWMYKDREYLGKIGRQAAAHVRQVIDEEAQVANFGKFLTEATA